MQTAVDVKQAVEAATAYLSSPMTVGDIQLEEVEVSSDERYWYITLSAIVPARKMLADNPSSLSALFKSDFQRIYKVFTVDSADQSVRSMKIRKIE